MVITASVAVNRVESGGAIPADFVGLSIEWTMIPRYMGDAAKRSRFANFLKGMGRGVLRIGGMSQEVCDTSHANVLATYSQATYLNQVRDTLVATGTGATRWTVLFGLPAVGTASCESNATAVAVTDRIQASFTGRETWLLGAEIGNEFNSSVTSGRTASVSADVRAAYPGLRTTAWGHHTFSAKWSEWQNGTAVGSPNSYRFDLWAHWPGLALQVAPHATLPFLTDHYYQLVNATVDSYPHALKPPTTTSAANARARLIDFEHMRDTAWQLYRKGEYASEQFGKKLRLSETNSCAGRGADNASNTMAAAIWALHYLFTVACPYDPSLGAASNASCDTKSQYVGVNFHNAEDNSLDGPGNASYNVVTDDGRALPSYYSLLLFGQYAQGKQGLRRIWEQPAAVVYRVNDAATTNVFIINKHRTETVQFTVTSTTASQAKWIKLWNDSGLAGQYGTMKLGGNRVAADGTFSWAFTPLAAGTRWTVSVAPGQAGMLQLY